MEDKTFSITSRSPSHQGSEKFQAIALGLGLGAVVFWAIVYTNSNNYAFGVFFIAALGFAIAIGQLYLHSILDRVLVIGRKDFYHGTSWSQLLFSGFLIFQCIAQFFIFRNEASDRPWIEFFLVLSWFLVSWSIPCFLATYLAIFKPQEGNQAQMSNEQHVPIRLYRIFFPREFIRFIKLNASQLPRLITQNRFVLYTLTGLFCGLPLLFLFLSITTFPLVSDWLQARGFDWVIRGWFEQGESSKFIVYLNYLIFGLFFISFVLILPQLYNYIQDEVISYRYKKELNYTIPGISFFLIMSVLFVIPPLLQSSLNALTSLSPIASGFLPLLAFFAWTGLSWKLWKKIPKAGINYLATPYQEAIFISIKLAWILIGLIVVFYFIQPIFSSVNVPWYGYSYLFYVLGCNYMAATDLRLATSAAEKLRATQMDDKLINHLAHELYNPLMPVNVFLGQEKVFKLLENNSYQAEADLFRSAGDGVGRAMNLLETVKNQGYFPLIKLKKQAIYPLLQDFVKEYRSQLSMRTSEEVNLQLTGLAKLSEEQAMQTTIERDLFLMMLRILVDNAVDATISARANNIILTLYYDGANRGVGHRQLCLSIQDTGSGMSPDVQERFGQNQVSHKPGGTGVGTAIAVRLARNMGCRLEILDTNNNGTRLGVFFDV